MFEVYKTLTFLFIKKQEYLIHFRVQKYDKKGGKSGHTMWFKIYP